MESSRKRTSIPHTSDISSAVGTMRNTIACIINVIPLHTFISTLPSPTKDKRNRSIKSGDSETQASLGASIDSAREPARLAGEVELEVEIEEVLECLPCDFADRALANACEDGVEELAGEGCAHSGSAVFMAIRI